MIEPFGVVSDTHYHNYTHFSTTNKEKLNTRLVDILSATQEAFDTMLKAGCTVCYHAGDMFHVRGKLSPSVLNPVKALYEEYSQKGLKFRILSGNHDLESENSEWLTSSSSSLASENIAIVNEATTFADQKVVMIPWVHKISALKKELEDIAETHKDYTVFIHAPLNEVIMGIPDNGLDATYLEGIGFKRVFCGHYHNHKSFNDKVFSVGALTHQNFGDVSATAGYLIVKDDKVCHHETSAPKFTDISSLDDESVVRDKAKGNYTRIRIGEASDIEIAEWRQILKSEGALGIQVIATPKTEIVGRSGATISKGGGTLSSSVAEWIEIGIDEEFREDVNAQALVILGEIE